MEAIKISVEVSVNLSENTQNFIKSLFGRAMAAATTQAQKPAPAAPAKPVCLSQHLLRPQSHKLQLQHLPRQSPLSLLLLGHLLLRLLLLPLRA